MKKNIISLILPLIFSSLAWASADPACMAKGKTLSVMNTTVLGWKAESRNQYQNRALIDGTIATVYPDKTGHVHFSMRIGANNKDTIEVVYNEKFGKVPELKVGSTVTACGDYITSNARTTRYAASPDGAIIHWVHKSNNNRHDDGFMIIDDVVYGL